MLIITLVPKYQGSHSDWKTWENGKAFSSQEKSGNFDETGKVRENHIKYILENREFQTNVVCYFSVTAK